jgi:hypothetical protein
MVDVALNFIVAEVNGYLRARANPALGAVVVGRIVDDNGKWAVAQDQIGAAVINLEEERTLASQRLETSFVNGRQVSLEPALAMTVHVIFAANFQKYDVALAYVSHVLTFFQSHAAFARDQHPGLDERIEKLSVQLQSLTYEQLNHVWAFIGGRQLPSAIYKMRLVTLQDREPASIAPPITRISTVIGAT